MGVGSYVVDTCISKKIALRQYAEQIFKNNSICKLQRKKTD